MRSPVPISQRTAATETRRAEFRTQNPFVAHSPTDYEIALCCDDPEQESRRRADASYEAIGAKGKARAVKKLK
jgi:hypothetical protein